MEGLVRELGGLVKIRRTVIPSAQSNVPQLTVVYGPPGHIILSSKKCTDRE